MLTENDLANGDVLATDNTTGVNDLINTLQNEIMRKHTKAVLLFKDKKAQAALELREETKELQKEVDNMMKSHMNYMKFLTAIGKNNQQQSTGVSHSLKNQKSSNGDIVQMIPKH